MSQRHSHTYKLTGQQQEVLADLLRTGNYRLISVPQATIAAQGPDCRISLYRSGKCLIQGKGSEDFVLFVLEPLVLREARLGYEDALNPEARAPHMGIDESGKGDFFGPLVIAGAYVDGELVPKFRELDVKDSKAITSEKKLLRIAAELRRLLGRRFDIVQIGPTAYNRLYAKMRNLNRLLSWGHARSIENLLERVPDCPRAVSDQFGNKSQVTAALMQKGRKITLEQRPRAESDIAVAAASILARAAFLGALKKMEEAYGLAFPKGASQAVQDTARKLVSKHGPTVLRKTAKCHFKTARTVLEQLKLDPAVLGLESVPEPG